VIKDIEETQRAYIHEYEVTGLYVIMGNAWIESNGHEEGREESINLVEMIKSMQQDVSSYKVDNERLMKAQEKQNEFNIKLFHSLEMIEKKVDKVTHSSKSKGHNYDTKKKESRSDGRHHHHHSPRHLFTRAENNPGLFPIRKHKRRYGVDKLQGVVRKIKPPTFDGEHKNDDDLEAWLLGIRKYFQLHNYTS